MAGISYQGRGAGSGNTPFGLVGFERGSFKRFDLKTEQRAGNFRIQFDNPELRASGATIKMLREFKLNGRKIVNDELAIFGSAILEPTYKTFAPYKQGGHADIKPSKENHWVGEWRDPGEGHHLRDTIKALVNRNQQVIALRMNLLMNLTLEQQDEHSPTHKKALLLRMPGGALLFAHKVRGQTIHRGGAHNWAPSVRMNWDTMAYQELQTSGAFKQLANNIAYRLINESGLLALNGQPGGLTNDEAIGLRKLAAQLDQPVQPTYRRSDFSGDTEGDLIHRRNRYKTVNQRLEEARKAEEQQQARDKRRADVARHKAEREAERVAIEERKAARKAETERKAVLAREARKRELEEAATEAERKAEERRKRIYRKAQERTLEKQQRLKEYSRQRAEEDRMMREMFTSMHESAEARVLQERWHALQREALEHPDRDLTNRRMSLAKKMLALQTRETKRAETAPDSPRKYRISFES